QERQGRRCHPIDIPVTSMMGYARSVLMRVPFLHSCTVDIFWLVESITYWVDNLLGLHFFARIPNDAPFFRIASLCPDRNEPTVFTEFFCMSCSVHWLASGVGAMGVGGAGGEGGLGQVFFEPLQ